MQLGYIPGQCSLLVTAHQLHNVACSGSALTVDAPLFQPHSRCAESTINGASMSEPPSSDANGTFFYIYIFYIYVSYVVLHIPNLLSNLMYVTSRIVQCSTMESYSNSSARVPESSGNREDRLQRRRKRESSLCL